MSSCTAIQSRQWLTTKEVAAMLRLEPMTIYRLRVSGELASTKIGGSRRFRIEDVEAYLAANFTPASTDQEATDGN